MRKADPALSRGEPAPATSESHIRNGDRLRDARRYAEAASAYRAALEIAPLRTDIRVQFGNMLKDSGGSPRLRRPIAAPWRRPPRTPISICSLVTS